jgi:biopolymer transport protein ExbD
MAKKLKKPQGGSEDLDLLPIMNLFSILIPFLLSMAVFQKLAVVEVNMPSQSEVPPDTEMTPPPDDNSLALTVAITDGYLEIWARGGSLPKVFAKEMVDFRCKADKGEQRIDLSQVKMETVKCENGQPVTIYDKERINMFAVARASEEDPGTMLKAVYNANDSAYFDANGAFLTEKSQLKVGGVYRTLDQENTVKIDPTKYNDAKVEFRSAYDELAIVLIDIHNKFIDMPDVDNIIILADDKVVFDKVIHVMDVAREAGFYNIQLAKLGG